MGGVLAFVFVSGVIGLLLNLVLIVVTLKRSSKDVDWLVILFISGLDILCSIFLGYRVLLQWIGGEVELVSYIGSMVTIAGTLLSLVLIGVLALVRYLAIVRDIRISKVTMYCVVLGVFVFGIYLARWLTAVSTLAPSKLYYIPSYWGDDLFSKFFGISNVSLYTVSLALVIYCYCRISCHYYSTLKQLGQSGWRLFAPVGGLFLVALVYLAVMFPQIFVFFYLMHVPDRTLVVDIFTIVPITCLPFINAMFTFLLHDESRYQLVSLATRRPYYSVAQPNYSDHFPYYSESNFSEYTELNQRILS